jgi:hypothetical protein
MATGTIIHSIGWKINLLRNHIPDGRKSLKMSKG